MLLWNKKDIPIACKHVSKSSFIFSLKDWVAVSVFFSLNPFCACVNIVFVAKILNSYTSNFEKTGEIDIGSSVHLEYSLIL